MDRQGAALLTHIEGIIMQHASSIGPLALTVFLPPLPQCFLTLKCGHCILDVSVGLGTHNLLFSGFQLIVTFCNVHLFFHMLISF